MAETTSFTLNLAFNKPGTAPHNAPAKVPSITIIGTRIILGKSKVSPIAIAVKPPASICPGVPMLNKPVLNAKATESPVKINGVAVAIVLPILSIFISPPLNRYKYPSKGLKDITAINIAPAIIPSIMANIDFKT